MDAAPPFPPVACILIFVVLIRYVINRQPLSIWDWILCIVVGSAAGQGIIWLIAHPNLQEMIAAIPEFPSMQFVTLAAKLLGAGFLVFTIMVSVYYLLMGHPADRKNP